MKGQEFKNSLNNNTILMYSNRMFSAQKHSTLGLTNNRD